MAAPDVYADQDAHAMDLLDSVPSQFLNDSIVTICVEGSPREYHVSKALLVTRSAWFERALDGDFKEGTSQRLEFPGSSPTTVIIFVNWLYTGLLPPECDQVESSCVDDHEPAGDSPSPGRIRRSYITGELIKLWAFGDEHLLTYLQEDAMAAIVRQQQYREQSISLDLIEQAYDSTAKDSAVTTLLVGMLAFDVATHFDDGATADTSLALSKREGLSECLRGKLCSMEEAKRAVPLWDTGRDPYEAFEDTGRMDWTNVHREDEWDPETELEDRRNEETD